MKFCPNCGAQLPDNAGFCSNCGTPLGAPPQYQQPQYQQPQYQQAPQQAAPQMQPQSADGEAPAIPKFCPYCGTATNGMKFCGNCGKQLA